MQYQLFHLISDAKGFVASINSFPVLIDRILFPMAHSRTFSFDQDDFQRANIMIKVKYKIINESEHASSAYVTIAMLQDFFEFLFLVF